MKQKINPYLRYSSMVFQMMAMIGIFAWIGYQIDLYFSLKIPISMLIFILLGVGGSLYQVIKSLPKENE
jgi:F0F1-type ATP synthase assembly protein I